MTKDERMLRYIEEVEAFLSSAPDVSMLRTAERDHIRRTLYADHERITAKADGLVLARVILLVSQPTAAEAVKMARAFLLSHGETP